MAKRPKNAFFRGSAWNFVRRSVERPAEARLTTCNADLQVGTLSDEQNADLKVGTWGELRNADLKVGST